LATPAI